VGVHRETDDAEFVLRLDRWSFGGAVAFEVDIARVCEHLDDRLEQVDGLGVVEVVDVDEPLYRQGFSNTMTNFV
jgi:hypothetical protein|tara:strand:+ start:97 stop:318 length:222 start_codon:yes stop_codon:yes gene_type:complete